MHVWTTAWPVCPGCFGTGTVLLMGAVTTIYVRVTCDRCGGLGRVPVVKGA